MSRTFNTIQVREMVRGEEMEGEMGGEERRGGKEQRRGEKNREGEEMEGKG